MKDLLLKLKECLKDIYRYFFRGQVTMSNSRFSKYNICPLQYKFYYEKRLKSFPSSHLHFGSAVHRALKEFHSKYDLKGTHGTFSDLIKEYEIAWDKIKEEMIDSVSGEAVHRWRAQLAEADCTEIEFKNTLNNLKTIYKSLEEEDEFKRKGVKMLEKYSMDNQANPNRIIGVEKQLMVTYRGMGIIAYIDRIEKTPEGEIVVVDYKAGMRIIDEEHIKKGDRSACQAMLYMKMIEKKWKKKLKNFYFYYLAHRKKVPCNPPKKFVDKLLDDMQDTLKAIKYERFEPSPNPLCGWCDYEVICPAWKGIQAPFKGIFRTAREQGRMTFSYSRMSSYKNCPYSYKKLYIDKIRSKPKGFFAIGHSCHEAMEEFFSYPYKSSLKKLRSMYKNHWHREGYKDEQEEREFFENGWNWMENYYKKYIDGQYIKAEAVEFYFQLPIGNDYVIDGYIDRLHKNSDSTYEIFDYKTDPKLRTQEEVDKDLQLTSYYWAMKQLGKEVTKLSLDFLKFTERITTKRTDEDISVFVEEVNKVVREMAQNEEELKKHPEKADELFPSKVNKYCGGCDFLAGCPMEKEIRTKYSDSIMNLGGD